MPNVADVRDVGVFELGLALGVSGVVGGGFPEVGPTHWSGSIRHCFSAPGAPNWSNKKKCLTHLNFEHKEEMSYFSYP